MNYQVLTRYFNSIKVRLEQIQTRHTHNLIGFQFHKGTIRTEKFRFHSVMLRLFQFHKGTIRTFNTTSKRGKRTTFQFHKGTIRT